MAATLLRATRLTRVVGLLSDGEPYLVEYDGRGLGLESVRVNRAVAAWRRSWLWFVPRFEFALGAAPAAVEVRVGPWLSIRGFRLSVRGEPVYSEGTLAGAEPAATPDTGRG
ncbi:MAG TPA: hypothetical protein VGF55_07875 [Gemmataceae bacterium]|jgi:hypothetical protein